MRLRELEFSKLNPFAKNEPEKPKATAPVPAKPSEPAPFIPSEHVNLLTNLAKQQGIKQPNDLANFLGQCKVETANWTKAAESFNYSDPVRIYKVFTSNFKNPEEAKPYVGNPIALANRALANKNGNGNEASGDGWKYRGRGFIHLTGRALYSEMGALAHPENPTIYVTNPTLLSTDPKEAALSAIAYFKNKVGKGKTSKQVTKVVNPAGLKSKERTAAAQQIKKQMASNQPSKTGQAATPAPKKPKPTQIAQK